jgi:putative ABC transport system permease protein
MLSLARKNLFHDKVRFMTAFIGIQFAVVLITVQIGVFLKFVTNASVIIDHLDADLWITAKNLRNFDFGRSISDKKCNQAREINGVLWAEKLLVSFALWKTPGGGQESIQLIGFNPETMIGSPWEIVEGNIHDVKYFNSVFIDEAERAKLGNLSIGGETEINNHKIKFAGVIRGARSFIGSPYVFTSFKNGLALSNRKQDETTYIVVKVAQGHSVEEIRDRLRNEIKDGDVYTKAEFSDKTRRYWLVTTGAGVALLAAALIGVAIGIVIVGQTIYASTNEHIVEFGTLKAIGASNPDVYKIIIEQALLSAAIGYGLGVLTTYFVVKIMHAYRLDVHLPWQAMVAVLITTIAMCISASVFSVIKVTRIDPALVFKN